MQTDHLSCDCGAGDIACDTMGDEYLIYCRNCGDVLEEGRVPIG
jgi:hypothetical protein